MLGSVASATRFYQAHNGWNRDQASDFADGSVGGFFFTRSDAGSFTTQAIMLNWYTSGASGPLQTPRHELTHMLIQQITGLRADRDVPAWFHEGSAVLEQITVPGAGFDTNANRYRPASAASLNVLIPISTLVSQSVWNGRPAPGSWFQYQEASEAVRQVRQDVGISGTVRILEKMRTGLSFDFAFESVVGRTTSDFYDAFPGRLRTSVPAYPGIATSSDTWYGPGLSYIAYGFAPGASLTETIVGPGGSTSSATADSYGAYESYIGSSWPAGTYTITVRDGSGRTATTTTVKSATLGDAWAERLAS